MTVPAGPVRVEALRGFEWIPADESVESVAGRTTTVELRLERLADPGASGWISGDTHVHDRHEGRWGITRQEFFDWLRADDLHVGIGGFLHPYTPDSTAASTPRRAAQSDIPIWRDPSGGTARTYARIDGPLTWRSWIGAVRAGRTMATNGPLLVATVDGREPGSHG